MSEHAIALAHEPPTEFRLACPRCRGPLAPGGDSVRCATCALRFSCEDGIWRLLPPERDLVVRRFVAEYLRIRKSEGWGSAGPDYYLALPFLDLTGRFEEIWRIRAASFQTLMRRVVVPLERARGRSLVALDLGAGNGWLSHRLSERGHRVAAIDLCDDRRDGLGARAHFPTRFTAVIADFDRLPLAGDQADLVVFNAALHYSPDARATLAEAFRVLHADGVVTIVDTPVYRNHSSGARMNRERQRRFVEEHGVSGGTLGSEGFLSCRRLREVVAELGAHAYVLHPLRWWPMRGRAVIAAARGLRETATFPVIVVRHAVRASERPSSTFRRSDGSR